MRLIGLVISEASQHPLPGAVVSIRRMADSTLVSGGTTNPAGRFMLGTLAPGQYRVEITSVGHTAQERADVTITAQAPRVDLGTVRLLMAAVALEGVTVQGQQSQSRLSGH